MWLAVFANNLLDGLFSQQVLVMLTLHKHIALVRALNRFLSHLDFGARILLQLANRFTLLADNEAYNVVRDRNDVGVGRRRAVRSHHAFIERNIAVLHLHRTALVQLLGHHQLLVPNLLTGAFVRSDDALNRHLRPRHGCLIVRNQEHVLLVVVVLLRLGTRLLRALAPNEDFAARLLLKSLLVEALGSNDHADVIDSVVLRNVNFALDLVCV